MMEKRETVIIQPKSNKNLLEFSELTLASEGASSSEWFSQQTTKNESVVGKTNAVAPLIIEKLNTIIVKQRLHPLEVCFCLARNNRYSVCNEDGDQIYYVYEDSVCFTRQLTGAMRNLRLKLTDKDQNGVLTLKRPAHCTSRCLWVCCSLQLMDIIVGHDEERTASIYEVWSCCIPEYHVVNKQGSLLWTVKGGVCHCRCCCQISFKFFTPEGDIVAAVTRECQGCHEFIGSANTFIIQFSGDLNERQKLIILGGAFLVDLNYFEKQNKCW